MNDLSKRIKQKRKHEGLTQSFVAKAVHVSQASIAQWENGAIAPRGDNLITLAKVLKCDPAWLLYGDKKEQQEYKSQKNKNSFVGEPSLNYLSSLEETSNYIELDFYDIEVSAGHGSLVIQEEEKSNSIAFNKNFINNELGVNANNVFLMPIKGDSMTPTLNNQAIVMVNKIDEFSGDGIYVFRFDGQLMVKRLQFTKNGLNVVSDNATIYPAWELTRSELKTEDFQIIGSVVWSGQRM